MEGFASPNEREARMKQEQFNRCNDMGDRLKLLFILKIISSVLNILLMVFVANSAAVLALIGADVETVITSAKVTVLTFELITLGIGIVYGILTMRMGKYMSEFSSAGLFTIIDALITFAYDYTGANVLSLIAAAFGILYVMRFADGMKMSLRGFSVANSVDSILACDWEIFKNMNIKMLIVLGISIIVMFVPFVNLLVLPVLLIVVIGAFALEIWELILMYKSSVSMRNYVPV